eukprot:gnl/TRDRNA2_/TRDRNA2_74629_c0_seq1.p1 gnl/TRDRNA2_/TRDRNA2_74629_c0~~gnl/TRDRNA2_/TRDRNA2_74629_c0_seq1.p1  ORF type:complete len:124 (+),score=7.71 gnl/TRDRNA2_/TRDRNA2_74629_c0_seq1:123-494(+)
MGAACCSDISSAANTPDAGSGPAPVAGPPVEGPGPQDPPKRPKPGLTIDTEIEEAGFKNGQERQDSRKGTLSLSGYNRGFTPTHCLNSGINELSIPNRSVTLEQDSDEPEAPKAGKGQKMSAW